MAAKLTSPANALISCQVLSFIKESKKKKRCKEKWQLFCQISYKKMDNNSSIMNIDAYLKLSSDDGYSTKQLLDPVILCDSDILKSLKS